MSSARRHSGASNTGPILPTLTSRTHRASYSSHSHYRRPHKRARSNDRVTTRNPMRGHLVAMSGELLGTISFLWFALSGTQIANTIVTGDVNVGQLFYIAASFGFSLAVNAWIFYRISGGLFNPAVTVGLCVAGAIPWLRGGLFVVAQLLGGIIAAALVSCMFPGELVVGTTLNHDTSIVQGLFIEMFLTTLLVLAVLFLAVEKQKATFIAPLGIGLALFVAELTGVYFTGGSLNPTRSFGPAVVVRSFPNHHWIYWLGPTMGAVFASLYYKFAKLLNYEEANPGQDAQSEREKSIA